MAAGAPFDLDAAKARLGPAAVAAARRVVDAAPPMTVEQRERLRAIFASAPKRQAPAEAGERRDAA